MKMTLNTQRNKPGYINTCLPKTMKLAKMRRVIINTEISHLYPTWPYQDRVLVWLLPNLEEDARRYHSGVGPELERMFQDGQLALLDEDIHKHLTKRINELINR